MNGWLDPFNFKHIDRLIRENERRHRLGDRLRFDDHLNRPTPSSDSASPSESNAAQGQDRRLPAEPTGLEWFDAPGGKQALDNQSAYNDFEVLLAAGVSLAPPDELDDDALTAALWEIIEHLAGSAVFLRHTDHLSERDLYEELWREILPASKLLIEDLAGHNRAVTSQTHFGILSMLNLSRDGDLRRFLRYYADEAQREAWTTLHPEYDMPAPLPVQYDRDRFLPQPPEVDRQG